MLLTTAGMQPFKPHFLGQEEPPAPRVADVQRCFRTTDIEEVGNTARHLTFFEMLGNWSFGDYFKEQSIPWGWELSTEGFGFDPERIWVTVFEGDEELGLGPGRGGDRDLAQGRRARTSGSSGCRARRTSGRPGRPGPAARAPSSTSTAARSSASRATGPGDDTDRFVEFWNHVFMTYDLAEDGTLTELPMKNIDTGMGLERMAAILQDVALGLRDGRPAPAGRAGRGALGPLATPTAARPPARCGSSPTTRAAPPALIADGVVPSNEDRGYVLRRIMRRAIQQGRSIGLEAPFMDRFAERALELLGAGLPGARRRARHRAALGRRRGGELRPHPRPRHRDAAPS